MQTPVPLTADDQINLQALDALNKLQLDTTSRKKQLAILLLSLAAFLGVGWLILGADSTTDLVILTLVIFIHEAGHYLGMRYFGYRNLKMFFIPLLGAAVSGRGSPSVAQDSLIFLLGPLPGIVIGYVCAALYLATGLPLLHDLARTFIVLNALNLAPIYPFDGGQFLFGLLPPRTWRVQWLLQLALGAAGAAITFDNTPWIAGSLIGIGLRGLLWLTELNNVAHKMVKKGLARVDTDSQTIPGDAAEKLVVLVRDECSTSHSKTIADKSWAAWKRVTARRPSLAQALYLLIAYGVGLSSIWVIQALGLAKMP